MKKNIKKYILILFLLTILIPIKTNATTLREYEDYVTKYTNELNDKNSSIAQSQEELKEIQAKISNYEKQIKAAEEEIKQLEAEIEKNNEEIKQKEKETKSIIEYYQISNGENAYLEYAFGANDITDMIYRLSIVEQLTDYNDKVMKELKEIIEKNKIKKQELAEKEVELEGLIKKMREQAKKVQGDINSMEGLIPNIKNQLSYYKERVEYYKKVGCKSDDVIGIDCDKPKPTSSGGRIASANGFVFPVNGSYYISTNYYWNGGSGHKGLDIVRGCGTPVQAVANGRVYYVGSGKDVYGAKMILIVHNVGGRLVFSQYAHLQGYAVGSNQDVYAGQTIGYIGSTGWSTGCHLHLEMSEDIGWDYNSPGNYWTYVKHIVNPYNYV